MIDRLQRLIEEIGSLQSKLALLVGAPGSGKTTVLRLIGQKSSAIPLNVGAVLGRRLAVLPQRQRPLEAAAILRDLANQHAVADLMLLDNIELLFDRTLQLDPLNLLKSHAHARRVLAVWPGDLRNGRLTYADMGHPEHQSYGMDGLIPFAIEN